MSSTKRGDEIDFTKLPLNIRNKRLQHKKKRVKQLKKINELQNKIEDHDIELINTMFNGMIKMMPQNKVTKNTNLLNMLKKENKLQISSLKNNELIDDSDNESENLKLQYNLDNLNECQLNSLKDNLGSIKKELQQNIDKLSI